MTRLVEETLNKKYDGKSTPRVALVSPIAFEDLGDPNLPKGQTQNKNLAAYTAALKAVAEETGVAFADVYHPTLDLFESSAEAHTLNGAHLNARGYRALAPILNEALFGAADKPVAFSSELKREVDDKNFHWWHRYRAVNGYSIYGKRGEAGSDGTYRNREVMERERAILDQMTANRDQRIWMLAQGETPPDRVDDSNTLSFITPKTNVGGADDPNRKRGKLGSLDYLPAAEQQKLFQLADGYEIQLVASEEQFPELANPVALNFDNRGRLWVSTMQSYPHWKPKTKLDDKLLVFEDSDGDGRADRCTEFAGGLHQPTGFELTGDGAYVAQQPDILLLRDTDGDGRADSRIRKLIGFDSADSHHGIAAFEWGPDGGLYFQEGTFKFSQVESPYGLTRLHEAGVMAVRASHGEIRGACLPGFCQSVGARLRPLGAELHCRRLARFQLLGRSDFRTHRLPPQASRRLAAPPSFEGLRPPGALSNFHSETRSTFGGVRAGFQSALSAGSPGQFPPLHMSSASGRSCNIRCVRSNRDSWGTGSRATGVL